MRVLVSGGTSYVFTSVKKPYVIQYFIPLNTVDNICAIHDCIKETVLNIEEIKYKINPFLFCPKLLWAKDKIILWEKVKCLNTLPPSFVLKNITKLLWDISKFLFAMHNSGVYHGDVSLDNIGYKEGNFVLFDYNVSDKMAIRDYMWRSKSDMYSLIKSLKYNLQKDFYCVKDMVEGVDRPYCMLMNIILHGEGQCINERIKYLDNIKIIL